MASAVDTQLQAAAAALRSVCEGADADAKQALLAQINAIRPRAGVSKAVLDESLSAGVHVLAAAVGQEDQAMAIQLMRQAILGADEALGMLDVATRMREEVLPAIVRTMTAGGSSLETQRHGLNALVAICEADPAVVASHSAAIMPHVCSVLRKAIENDEAERLAAAGLALLEVFAASVVMCMESLRGNGAHATTGWATLAVIEATRALGGDLHPAYKAFVDAAAANQAEELQRALLVTFFGDSKTELLELILRVMARYDRGSEANMGAETALEAVAGIVRESAAAMHLPVWILGADVVQQVLSSFESSAWTALRACPAFSLDKSASTQEARHASWMAVAGVAEQVDKAAWKEFVDFAIPRLIAALTEGHAEQETNPDVLASVFWAIGEIMARPIQHQETQAGQDEITEVMKHWDDITAAIPTILGVLTREEEAGALHRRLQSSCYRCLSRVLGVGAVVCNKSGGDAMRETLAGHCEKLMPRSLAVLARATNAPEVDRQAAVVRLQDSAAECVNACQSLFPGSKGRRWCLRLLGWTRVQLRSLRERVDAMLGKANPLIIASLKDAAESLAKLAAEESEAAASALEDTLRQDRVSIVFGLLHGLRLMQVAYAASSEVTTQIAAASEAATAEGATEEIIKEATEARDELADASAEWLREALPHSLALCGRVTNPKLMCLQALQGSMVPLTLATSGNLLRLTRTEAVDAAKAQAAQLADLLRIQLASQEKRLDRESLEAAAQVTEVMAAGSFITAEQAQDVLLAGLEARRLLDDAVAKRQPKSIPLVGVAALAVVVTNLVTGFPEIIGPMTDDILAFAVSAMQYLDALYESTDWKDTNVAVPAFLKHAEASHYFQVVNKVVDIPGALLQAVMMDAGGPEVLQTRLESAEVQEVLGRFGPKLVGVKTVFSLVAPPSLAILKWYMDVFKPGAARAELAVATKDAIVDPEAVVCVALAATVVDKAMQIMLTCDGIFPAEHTTAAGIGQSNEVIQEAMMLAPRLAQLTTTFGQRLRAKNLGPWNPSDPDSNSKDSRLLSMQMLFHAFLVTQNPLAQMFMLTEEQLMQMAAMQMSQMGMRPGGH